MENYYFFLSYSRLDNTGAGYIKKFYDDLTDAVCSKLGRSVASYFDVAENEPGDRWPDKIARALQTSKVFICLYSRGYFNSPYCGKEFQVFLDRVNQYIRANPQESTPPSLIIPVLWDSPDRLPKQLPKVINEIQYTHSDFGNIYSEEGLNLVMRQQQYSDAYQNFLIKLATRIVDESEAHPLDDMPNLPKLAEVKPLFPATVAQTVAATGDTRESEDTGPNVIKFIFVAGPKSDLKNIRNSVESYGQQGGREWQPYYPQGDAVEFLVQGVTCSERLFYDRIAVNDDLVEHISEAEKTNIIVVMIVDPWSVKIYQQPLLAYDSRSFLNCGLIIPWNENDTETKRKKDQLQEGIKTTFIRNYVFNSPYIRDSVSSAADLQRKLILIINEVRRRLIQQAEVHRKMPDGDSNNSLPTIP